MGVRVDQTARHKYRSARVGTIAHANRPTPPCSGYLLAAELRESGRIPSEPQREVSFLVCLETDGPGRFIL